MAIPSDTQTYVNDSATSSPTRTRSTQPRSRAVHVPTYELIGPDGKRRGIFKSAKQAGDTAKRIWPGLEEGSCDGWNVQTVGADR